MAGKFTTLTPELYDYLVAHGTRPDDGLARAARASEEQGELAVMQTAPDQAALITLVVAAIGARRALEVGAFTGYGAIAIGRALPPDGLLVSCEVSEDYAEIARANVDAAGLGGRVEIRVGPAAKTLAALGDDGSFDFAYIDADKEGYPAYYERTLQLLRPGGVLMLDNVLLGGRVLDPATGDGSARAIAELNDRIAADERVDVAMLAISDGVTLARKR